MKFAQFYQRSAVNPANIIEACGDRSVIILDGRECGATHHGIAEFECRARGYVGYSLHSGDSFTRSHQVAPYREVHYRYTLHRADGIRVGEAQTAQGIGDRARNAHYSRDSVPGAYPFVAWRFDALGMIGEPFATEAEAVAECARVSK